MLVEPVIRQAVFKDVYWMSLNIRDEDTLEIQQIYGWTAEQGISISYLWSKKVWTVVRGDVILTMFGVSDSPDPKIGVPWMLCAQAFDTVGYRFAKHCREKDDEMMEGYDSLENIVSINNTKAILWLEWCGFKFIEILPGKHCRVLKFKKDRK